MYTFSCKLKIFLALFLVVPISLAHETHIHANAFVAGISHPVLGLDHLLAMVAVGLVSAVMGGSAIWQVPLVFVATMILGGIAGGYALDLPYVEIGISLSVIALGMVLAIGQSVPFLATLIFVAAFGFLHGHAHGTEMPEMAEPLLYGGGFVIGTIGLHLLGVLLGVLSKHVPKGNELVRLSGFMGCLAGIYLLNSLFA